MASYAWWMMQTRPSRIFGFLDTPLVIVSMRAADNQQSNDLNAMLDPTSAVTFRLIVR
jgi:hypothetical protein